MSVLLKALHTKNLLKKALLHFSEKSNAAARITGTVSDKPYSILFTGREFLISDFNQLFFNGNAEVALIDAFQPDSEDCLVITDKGYFNSRRNSDEKLLYPSVDMLVDISSGFDHFLSDQLGKRKRNNVKRALKENTTYRTSNSSYDIEQFYNDLYVPMIREIHGNNAHIETVDEFHAKKEKLTLIIIEQDGKPIGITALLNSNIEKSSRIWKSVTTPKVFADSKRRSSVTCALDALSILTACNNRYQFVSFGITPPSLINSMYKHKLMWGASHSALSNYPRCGVKTLNEHGQDLIDHVQPIFCDSEG